VARGDVCVHHVRADEARPSRHQDLHASPSAGLKYSMVFLSPSPSAPCGSQPPRSFRARVMSGCRTFGSSTGRGRKTISLLLFVSALMRSANSRMVVSIGLPQFTGLL